MNIPELTDLRRGDPQAWDVAFQWLWPTALAVAQSKLARFCPGDMEDIAIEALEELVDKSTTVGRVEELKPLVASIAHHRAVSLLRERFARKRGGGKIESLDGGNHPETGSPPEPPDLNSPLDALEQKELAERIQTSLATLKPPLGGILQDFYLHGCRYEEIAKKHQIAIGSVGVYLSRGLKALRGIWEPERKQL